MQHSYLQKVQAWQELMAQQQSTRDRTLASSMGPAILVSGFLTKKTRKMNRWKRRWWQLLDNGMLLYFKDDERLKLLGEIDVGRTCYDVRLGADRCKVSFPRVVPSVCCVAFSVLKRTYYMYAPTAAEAKRWAENLYNVSLVLNRRGAANRKRAPGAPGLIRAPSCPPNLYVTRKRAKSSTDTEDITRLAGIQENAFTRRRSKTQLSADAAQEMSGGLAELQDKATELPVFQRNSGKQRPLLAHHKLHSSMPGYLDQIRSPESLSEGENPRMWLDGSPPPSMTTSTFKPGLKIHPSYLERPQVSSSLAETQALSSSYSQNLDSITRIEIPDNIGGGTVPRMGEKRKRERISLPSTFMSDYAKLEQKEARIRKKLEQFEAPVRPASVSDFTQVRSSYLPPQGRPRIQTLGGVPVLPTLTKRYTCPVIPSPKIPPPVKPKPPKREPSFVTATRIIAMTTSPTGLEDSTSVTTTNVATIHEEKEVEEEDQSQEITLTPRKNSGPPNFIPPPPPSRSSSVSSSEVTSPSWTAQRARSSTVITGTNICSDHELQKLIAETKRYGELSRNGQTTVALHKLIARKHVFENLMGTLLIAKQHQIVGYEGELLHEGRDDNTFITLLRDNL